MKKLTRKGLYLITLILSLAGNIYQGWPNAEPRPVAATIDAISATDEKLRPEYPDTIADWDVWATFAITYMVGPGPATPGGGTVTVAYEDPLAPRLLRKKGKPGPADVFWEPALSCFNNISDIEVCQVVATEIAQ